MSYFDLQIERLKSSHVQIFYLPRCQQRRWHLQGASRAFHHGPVSIALNLSNCPTKEKDGTLPEAQNGGLFPAQKTKKSGDILHSHFPDAIFKAQVSIENAFLLLQQLK